MPSVISGGPDCSHPATSREPLEGTPFIECISCHAILDGNGTVVLEQPPIWGILARKHDQRVDEGTVTDVKRHEGDGTYPGGWEITHESSGFGNGFVLSDERNPDGFAPRAGDGIRIVTVQVSFVVGVYFERDGEWTCIYHETPTETNERDVRHVIEQQSAQARQFADELEKLDAIYAALPPVMQRRIDKYRRNNPSFRVKFENYESMVCRDAVRIAEKLRPEWERVLEGAPDQVASFVWPEAVKDRSVDELRAELLENFSTAEDPDAFLRNVVAWRLTQAFDALPWEEQKDVVDDGHSGNSFGMACRLAWLYLAGRDDDLVGHYGALARLVGSDEYGDSPKNSETVAV